MQIAITLRHLLFPADKKYSQVRPQSLTLTVSHTVHLVIQPLPAPSRQIQFKNEES
jgi:hypothetical protein